MMILALLTLSLPSLALDPALSSKSLDKPASTAVAPPADVDVLRQGGDTIADAVLVTIPVVDLVGTTTGYTDDYDHDCPYGGGTAPDVVYSIIPDESMGLNIDMFGSAYDTKIWVYDVDLNVIGCNDDYYPDYTSRIENMLVNAGEQYYLIIDGYSDDHGEYLLNIEQFTPCELDVPAGAMLEGEPPLAVDYVDTYNGGCGNGGTGGWQYWDSPALLGVSGNYILEGANYRDTDWFEIPIGPEGILVIEGDAQFESYMFELGPQDCNEVAVIQNMEIGPCTPATMTIVGEPGSMVWFWVGPQFYESPDGSDVFEFNYTLVNHSFVVGVEDHSWSGVKALFR